MIFYKNGKVKSKEEAYLTEKDFQKAKFFMISVSSEAEHYIPIKPSEYLHFDKAIIDYQLCGVAPDEDYEYVETDDHHPVHIETTSIADLITLINSSDRLDLVNYTMSGFVGTIDSFLFIGMTFFSVKLIRDKRVIYNRCYRKKGTSTVAFDSYQVTKKFKDIYDGDFLIDHRIMFLLRAKGNHIEWEMREIGQSFTTIDYSDIEDNTLVGISSSISNTIIFQPIALYKKLIHYPSVQWRITVFETREKNLRKLSNLIRSVKTIDESSYYDIFQYSEVYLEETFHMARRHWPYVLFDMFASMPYIMNMILMLYGETFGNSPIGEHADNVWFDALFVFRLQGVEPSEYVGSNYVGYSKDIIMTSDTILSLDDILLHL